MPAPSPNNATGGLSALGEALRQGREAQGLSIAELAGRLNMGLEQLQALEAADTSRLPEAVFVIAQARRVASSLAIDISGPLQMLRANGPSSPRPPVFKPRPPQGQLAPAQAQAHSHRSWAPWPWPQQSWLGWQRQGYYCASNGCSSGPSLGLPAAPSLSQRQPNLRLSPPAARSSCCAARSPAGWR